jgi:DNA-binding winged helix-turn-helix (wHTH) protein/tetratricopeptide (TPR) repeat protein
VRETFGRPKDGDADDLDGSHYSRSSVIERRAEHDAAVLNFDDCEVDFLRHQIRRGGEVRPVEPQVFDVLAHLIANRERTVTKEELLDEIWGSRFVSESALTSRIKDARRAVGDDGRSQRVIRTVHGRGYQFVADIINGLAGSSAPESTLLERDADLAALHDALADAAHRRSGRVILISGEAGVGKSSLVSAFAAAVADRARLLIGACDDLVAPRTLGPFHDMARASAPALAAALGQGDREAFLEAIERELGQGPPTRVLVVEDAHWADDATLDTIRWLLRRIIGLAGMVVITYRSTEVDSTHPLQRVMGATPAGATTRIDLAPLSLESVDALALAAGRRVDADALLRTTGGNPFFVTEVLASDDVDIPASVVDAVLARLHELPEDSRRALERFAVVPGSIDLAVARALVDDLNVLDEAERRQMLAIDGGSIRFRHEIARRSIEQSLTELLRTAYHAEVLQCLVAFDASPSALVHHAAGAHDVDALVRYGPVAAEEAMRGGAHRQAAEHYRLLLEHSSRFGPEQVVELRVGHAYERYLIGDMATAESEARQAVSAAEEIGDDQLLVRALSTLSRVLHWWDGSARLAAERAIELLGDDGPPELEAVACVNLASDLVLADRHIEAAPFTERALLAARRAGRRDLESLTLVYRATAKSWLGDPEGESELIEAIELAEQLRAWEYAARGCINLVGMLFRQGRLGETPAWIERAVTNSEEGEFIMGLGRSRSLRCGLWLYQGRFDEAERELRDLTGGNDPTSISWLPLSLLGRVLARRSDPEAGDAIERAQASVAHTDDPQRKLTVAAVAIEHAWLVGDDRRALERADDALRMATATHHPQLRGEIHRYVQRAGGQTQSFEDCPLPYHLGITGNNRGAAKLWEALGFPFEQALELGADAERDEIDRAVRMLEELGASGAATRVRA